MSEDETMTFEFELRNIEGGDSSIEVSQHYLGLEPYILLTAGEEGPVIEGSHVSPEELAALLALAIRSLVENDQLDKETVDMIRALLSE